MTVENGALSVTPYFSPDHSVGTIVDFINNATNTLDIMTPGFSSWSRCTSVRPRSVDCL